MTNLGTTVVRGMGAGKTFTMMTGFHYLHLRQLQGKPGELIASAGLADRCNEESQVKLSPAPMPLTGKP